MNTVIHLRKLCNHPFLFHSVEDSFRAAWNLPEFVGLETILFVFVFVYLITFSLS